MSGASVGANIAAIATVAFATGLRTAAPKHHCLAMINHRETLSHGLVWTSTSSSSSRLNICWLPFAAFAFA